MLEEDIIIRSFVGNIGQKRRKELIRYYIETYLIKGRFYHKLQDILNIIGISKDSFNRQVRQIRKYLGFLPPFMLETFDTLWIKSGKDTYITRELLAILPDKFFKKGFDKIVDSSFRKYFYLRFYTGGINAN